MGVQEAIERAIALKNLATRAVTAGRRLAQIAGAEDDAELAALNAELDEEIARLEPLAHAKLRGEG